MIGLATTSLLLFNGDILGFSGIISGALLDKSRYDHQWKLAFVASFIIFARFFNFHNPSESIIEEDVRSLQLHNLPIVSSWGFIISGFLNGFGTKLGNGCTSGHGVCGLGRKSKRSLVATLSFMSTAILTATMCQDDGPIGRYLRIPNSPENQQKILSQLLPTTSSNIASTVIIALATLGTGPILSSLGRLENDKGNTRNGTKKTNPKLPVAIISGAMISYGLSIMTSMVKQTSLFGFLKFDRISKGKWDPSLAFVMGSAVFVSLIGYQVKSFLPKPIIPKDGKFNIPTNTVIDAPLIIGASIFGVGMGIGGLCPAPALFRLANGCPDSFLFWPSFFLGRSCVALFR
jgi:uncharacterized membrane protein YedE/YeeE